MRSLLRKTSANSLLMVLLLTVMAVGTVGAAPAIVILHATQDIILADGKAQVTIWAEVHDSNGRPINGATVEFQTTAGTLSQTRSSAFNGRAETRLTSGVQPGVAHITAIVEGADVGVANPLDIQFTDDPEETLAGNSYFLATGSYVAYSPLDHVIEAHGENGSARLTYRTFTLTADRYQLKCDDTAILRAYNHIVMRRGKDVIHAIRLYYSLVTGDGFAVAEVNGQLHNVQISGVHMTLKPIPTAIPTSYVSLPDLQQKLIVAARSISYLPGEKLQFRRPRFFQDGTQIMALPYYEMPLNSQELFSDHFLSVGSRGLGLTVPYYYSLSPTGSGVLTLSHQEPLTRGYSTSEPGWSLDMLQSYSGNGVRRFDGNYGFTGLLHPDWGFHWSHSQELNPNTQGSFYLDFPQHDSVNANVSLTQQEHAFRVGLNLSAGDQFALGGESNLRSEAYAETNPHQLIGMKGLQYVFTTRVVGAAVNSPDPVLRAQGQSLAETAVRAFTRPVHLDKQTTVTTSVTLGQIFSVAKQSGTEGIADISLNRRLAQNSILSLAYDYDSVPGAVLLAAGGKHRASLVYQFTASKHFQATLFGSSYLDSPSRSLVADMAYRLNSNWRVLFSATVEQDYGLGYKDFEFTLGRRIGARELELSYSTYYRRIFFDLTTTAW
jgi:hypothetical protein